MGDPIDKIDVVEALANELDDRVVAGLGFTLAGADGWDDGTLVLQTWPNGDDQPSVDFLCRVTRFRPRVTEARNPYRKTPETGVPNG